MKGLIPTVLAVVGMMPNLPPVQSAGAFEPYRWKHAQAEVRPISCDAAGCGLRRSDDRMRQRDEDSAPAQRDRPQPDGLLKRRSESGMSNDRQETRRYLPSRPRSGIDLRRRPETPSFVGRDRASREPIDREWRDTKWRDEDWHASGRHTRSTDAWRPYPPGAELGFYASPAHRLTREINAALREIERGEYAAALWRLRNDVLERTDGCADSGFPDGDDWIDTCADQLAVYNYVQLAIQHLETLVYGS